ncbi:fasciclin domain-containing protein [soil metagenome]
MKKLLAMALIAFLGAGAHSADKTEAKDIVDTAVGAKDFTTLVAAVKEAALVETLKGKGPFTVFAPTDEAFKKLGDETIKKVLADKELLKKILLVHVVSGTVMAEDVMKMDGKSAETVGGTSFKITANKDGVKIGDAKVTKTDIKCSNGVIHVIDTVLMPK